MSWGDTQVGGPCVSPGTHSPPPAETLGALASVLSIWVVTGALVYLAAARIVSNDYEIEARAMLATSASAVGVNLMYVLHRAVRPRIPPHTPGLSLPSRAPAPHVPPVPQGSQVTFCPCAPSSHVPKR